MAKVNQRSRPYINTIDDIVNKSFDGEFDISLTEPVGYDGASMQRTLADSLNHIVSTVGTATYVCLAAPGTAADTAKWQVFKIDTSSGVVVTYADGDSNFDNIATDPASLF